MRTSHKLCSPGSVELFFCETPVPDSLSHPILSFFSDKWKPALLKHSVLEGGRSEKVPILIQLLHFSGQSDGGEW